MCLGNFSSKILTRYCNIAKTYKMRPTPLGQAYHIERALAVRQGITRYPCACEKCHGFKTQSVQTIETHHRKYGRDTKLVEPLLVSSGLKFSYHYYVRGVAYPVRLCARQLCSLCAQKLVRSRRCRILSSTHHCNYFSLQVLCKLSTRSAEESKSPRRTAGELR